MNDRSSIGGVRGKLAPWLVIACLGSCTMDDRPILRASALSARENADSGAALAGGSRPGTSAAGIEYGPAQLDIGSVVLGYAAFGRLRMSNFGTEPSSVPTVSLAPGGSPNFAIALNQCDRPLAPGARCDVRVQVIPSAPGSIEATLQLSDVAGNVSSVPLAAFGVAGGDLALRPADGGGVDFGGVLVGSLSEAPFRVTNPTPTGSGALSFNLANSEFQLAPPRAGECQLGAPLASGQSCDVRLIYTPASRGRQDATLTVTSTDLGSQSLGLIGQGWVPGAFSVTPNTQDFRGVILGSVGLASLQIQNGGDLPLTIAGVAVGAGAPTDFAIASAQCGAGDTLAGGDFPDSCTLEVEFRPRTTGDAATELVLTSSSGLESRMPLLGRGLLPGSIIVAPTVGSSAGFGDVLMGEASTEGFTVSNPSAEPSGTFSIETAGAFSVLPATQPSDCQAGVTSLANAESCTVIVALSPTARGGQAGTLTVESQLAGSTSVSLTGRGLLPAVIATVQEEVSFGRVVRGRPSQGSLSVRNDGDAPLAPPSLAINSAVSGVASDFSWASACAEPLAPGTQCNITLTLLPTVAGSYSATLGLASPDGGAATVLLLAEVIEPGSLVLAVEAGASADFGDTAVNVPVTKNFSLTNPGGEPSGPLSIATNDTHFVVNPGECGAGIGIANGESCAFSVTFTPDSSVALTSNLTVESITAGIATLSLSGRGRVPATLAGSNEFNFNTVVATKRSAPRTWTVTNAGDLQTGLLATTGANPEFVVDSDTCAGRTLAPAAACTMNLTFAPLGTGPRQAAIAVTDSAEGGSVSTLAVSGIGQSLPAVGEACLDGTCATGATCENHSNGLAQVCCGADCTGNQRCSEGQSFLACELPSVGPGARCVAGTNVCSAGLTCDDPNRPGFCCPTACSGPCQACSEAGTCDPLPDQTKGGCSGNKVCVGGTCNCAGLNRESLDCGGDRCIRDVEDACCDDGGCAGAEVCGANDLCGCPAGTRECTPGGSDCTPDTQCCNCSGPCQTCTNGVCGTVQDGQPGLCGSGQECRLGGCVLAAPALLAAGSACGNGSQCQSGVCTGGICCGGPCAGPCSTCQAGTGACVPLDRTPCGNPGQLCIGGSCRSPTVRCNGVTQEVNDTNVCCDTVDTGVAPTEAFTTSAACPPSHLDVGGLTTTPIRCDDNSDCITGQSCCLRALAESAIECIPDAECDTPTTTVAHQRVCSSPQGFVAACDNGSCGERFFMSTFVTGWGICPL